MVYSVFSWVVEFLRDFRSPSEKKLKWSWRELNPRPNKEAIRFLHAYSSLRFSWCTKTWTTKCTLILWKLHPRHEAAASYPRFCCTANLNASGKWLSVRCLVPMSNKGIKQVYYTSTKQRERKKFRQLICWSLIFRSQATMLRMLTYHLNSLSNPISPELVPSLLISLRW